MLILGLLLALAGCNRKSQDAVIVGKEHIAAHIEELNTKSGRWITSNGW
jgi:hypothetical protein